MDTDTTTPTCTACVICHRGLLDHELGQYTCQLCRQRMDENLRLLAGPRGLYARLSTVLAPGTSTRGGRVSGSKTPPLPVRLGALSLVAEGGIPTILKSWARDWASYGKARTDWRGTLQQQVDQAVQTLRFNLEWAVSAHPAVDEFAREIAQLRGACEQQITGETPERRFTAYCANCGGPIRIRLSTHNATCPDCGHHHDRTAITSLDTEFGPNPNRRRVA